MDIPICECATYWPGKGHHPECPVRAEIYRLRDLAIQWHRVEDGMPDDDESVLLACDDGEVQVGFHEARVWHDLDAMPIEYCAITHWAQIPAHPEAQR